MSGFTERTVQRALGASGRIQPRIAPITAPNPWVEPVDMGLGLEVYEEIEAPGAPAMPGGATVVTVATVVGEPGAPVVVGAGTGASNGTRSTAGR